MRFQVPARSAARPGVAHASRAPVGDAWERDVRSIHQRIGSSRERVTLTLLLSSLEAKGPRPVSSWLTAYFHMAGLMKGANPVTLGRQARGHCGPRAICSGNVGAQVVAPRVLPGPYRSPGASTHRRNDVEGRSPVLARRHRRPAVSHLACFATTISSMWMSTISRMHRYVGTTIRRPAGGP